MKPNRSLSVDFFPPSLSEFRPRAGNDEFFSLVPGTGPILATAIHHGHRVSPECLDYMRLTSEERLREEDPFTGGWTEIVNTRLIGRHSRFEADLNRPREKAVYLKPEDAWGLEVWRVPPPPHVIAGSVAHYDEFYQTLSSVLEEILWNWGGAVVLDLHTYNHRREGPDRPPADPRSNPTINVGTAYLDRDRWGKLVERFMEDLRGSSMNGGETDVRENVKFKGGFMVQWINQHFPDTICAIALEVKKYFMDEWTGRVDREELAAIQAALAKTVPGLEEELRRRVQWMRLEKHQMNFSN